ncbi:MAG: hypothetical protein K6T80_03925 [Firmicutes bacterium]|nr:hypothetical protein [Bacillota bacterium]
MEKSRLKGLYIPDKDGKLRPVIRLSDIHYYLPATASSAFGNQPPYPAPGLLDRTWKWIKRYL